MGTKSFTHSRVAQHAVERQLSNWEFARQQQTTEVSATKPVQDFVAISRQVGSGGSEIAAELAGRLKWPLFDKDVLQQMAGDDTVREGLYRRMDEYDKGWLEQMLEYALSGRFPPQDYVHKLGVTMLTLARGARGVFLGRAADLILPAGQGVRVRVVAPPAERIKRYAAREHMTEIRAREEVARIDAERAMFIRHHFRREIEDPLRSDLTINTARLTVPEATELIIALLRARRIIP